MKISFPDVPSFYTVDTTVAFRAQVDGVELTCEISTEALQDHFGATSANGIELVAAFEANRAAIEDVVRLKLTQSGATGRFLLVSADF